MAKMSPPPSEFFRLLSFVEGDDRNGDIGKSRHQQQVEAFEHTPIYTAAVDKHVHSILKRSSALDPTSSPSSSSSYTTVSSSSGKVPESKLIPQYGLIGIRQESGYTGASAEDRLVLANMNMPWSAFICGSQGAGKSHTLSCLLESALVADNAAGKLTHPLAGMVLHYDNYASYSSAQICEQAYICSSGIPVTVLVSPSNIWGMKEFYENLPGMKPGAPKPKVLPLYLDEDRLDIQTILKLMAVDPTAKDPPLYMEIVMNIARELAMEGGGFSYSEFRRRILNVAWVRGQDTALNLRLQLLDAIITPSSTTKTTRPAPAKEDIWSFEPGSLTIVDLSDPFFSSDDACTLFSICLSIFLEERHKCGRVVVLDEAHKFLGQSGEAEILTGDLLSIIRQQRHLGTRVLIATQEPTLSPKLIDLVNATFVHRFLSPSWYKVLEGHLAGANKEGGDRESLFTKIMSLRTGEALLFCPTAQLDVAENFGKEAMVKTLSDSYAKVKIRKRLTADGGRSIMATEAPAVIKAHTAVDGVPMHLIVSQPKGRKVERIEKGNRVEKGDHAHKEAPVEETPTTKQQTSSVTNIPTNSQTVPVPSPVNSNVSNPISPPIGGQLSKELNKTLRAELRKKGKEMFKGNWSSFQPLTENQMAELCFAIDAKLELQPGTTRRSSYAQGKCLNGYLAKCKKKKH
ncbi:hypothetical protein GGR53DRAFT_523906 [Hypoxylon sp. FL1150]|nr:hypothetical protein GGR53DRAFT_523906 [Hypoxylon sp. FL1150]